MASHATAVLKMPRRVGAVALYAQSIINGINKNLTFPAPTPTIAAVEADLAAFIAAEAVAETRAKGAADARNAKLAQLRVDLEYLAAYVQLVADAAPPATAAAMIESAALFVKKVGSHTKGKRRILRAPLPALRVPGQPRDVRVDPDEHRRGHRADGLSLGAKEIHVDARRGQVSEDV
jgi:hypothetical protein